MCPPINDDEAWAAFSRRDRAFDGCFVGAVKTTGIYCRPSCAARHPRRENVIFFADGAVARGAGFRSCRRCLPDEVSREEIALRRAYLLLSEERSPLNLAALAGAVGYSPQHFHRLFKRATGVTPAAFARAKRGRQLEQALDRSASVTEAIYDAGFSGPSRFYREARQRLGMTPSAWRDGGRGKTVRWVVADSAWGPMLIAATDQGVCRLAFVDGAEGQADLEARFPNADIRPGGEEMRGLAQQALAAVAAPERAQDLPLDIGGTAFQQAVWRELSRVPPGQTVSYAALAARAGKPGAARAAGTACGANPLAVLVPCHRARRGDGSAGGYAWGLERKAALLAREGGGLL
ncbi:MAG TPA: bifunctional DNA-binding transcriptional regulator/O6-methylguanine-DNA methyltransferase Ada [Sphingomonadaceae bacterium]|nr:bifunctional DNA-binding transcriptional regulator/O6-methylguanine-DNA methyltransferase Ada [Sphingomonadaceae bacterium]